MLDGAEHWVSEWFCVLCRGDSPRCGGTRIASYSGSSQIARTAIRASTKSQIITLTMTDQDAVPVGEELFEKVASIVGDKNVKPARKSSFSEKARLYGLYKRATVGKLAPPYDDGDSDTDKRPKSRPGILSVESRAKYDAWLEADVLSKQEARDAYVKLAEDLVGQPVTDAIQQAKK